MTTLRSWADKNGVVVARHGHARSVNMDSPNQADLWRLDDYLVSSVAAGTVWLIRREPFSESERRQRGTMRNSCVDMNVTQLEIFMDGMTDEFAKNCIEEYKFELEAEQRDAERR